MRFGEVGAFDVLPVSGFESTVESSWGEWGTSARRFCSTFTVWAVPAHDLALWALDAGESGGIIVPDAWRQTGRVPRCRWFRRKVCIIGPWLARLPRFFKRTRDIMPRHPGRSCGTALLLGVHTFITKCYHLIRVVGAAKSGNRIGGRPNILTVGRHWDAPRVEIATALSYA